MKILIESTFQNSDTTPPQQWIFLLKE